MIIEQTLTPYQSQYIAWLLARLAALHELIIDEPDFEWLMVDACHCKVHPHAAGGSRRESGYEPYKRGLNNKIDLAVGVHCLPVRAILTEGTRADCAESEPLIDGFRMDYLLANNGYDSDDIVAKAQSQDSLVVIPPRKNRKQPRRLSTICAIRLKTPFCISIDGVEMPHATQKNRLIRRRGANSLPRSLAEILITSIANLTSGYTTE